MIVLVFKFCAHCHQISFWRVIFCHCLPFFFLNVTSYPLPRRERLFENDPLIWEIVLLDNTYVLLTQVAPTKYRGSLGSLCQIGTCVGIIASLCLAIPSENDPHWWRTMLYIASVPGYILALGMQFSVESPRWLCKAGRLDEAKRVIKNLWGSSEVDKAIKEFESVIKNDGGDLDSSWLELLEEPHSRVAAIGGALFVLQQLAGINGVLYFSSLTFKDVGISSSALASLYVGLTNFAGALCALYLMDKQGRQRLLVGSYTGMALSMFLIVYAISFPMDGEISNNLSILGTILYIFTFAVGAGPVTGLIIPELSSSRTRGKIMGFSFSVHWVYFFWNSLRNLVLHQFMEASVLFRCWQQPLLTIL